MAYEKQTWQCGDVVTADKLNHIEDGIANSGGGGTPLIVTFTEEGEECERGGTAVKATCSHSWQEIYDALTNGTPVWSKTVESEGSRVTSWLEPIVVATTDNASTYQAISATQRLKISFPNATDKWWYSQPCK